MIVRRKRAPPLGHVARAASPWERGLGAYDGLLEALRRARQLGKADEFWLTYRTGRKTLGVREATVRAAQVLDIKPGHL